MVKAETRLKKSTADILRANYETNGTPAAFQIRRAVEAWLEAGPIPATGLHISLTPTEAQRLERLARGYDQDAAAMATDVMRLLVAKPALLDEVLQQRGGEAVKDAPAKGRKAA